MTFEKLKQIIESGNITFNASTISQDGRVNSIKDEDKIALYIKNLFGDKCNIAPPRFWYDVALTIDGKFYPINIKSVTGKTADNISSKDGMFYAITGLDPRTEKVTPFKTFENKLLNNINYSGDADYYFVIFFKETKEIFFTSLKRVCTLTPNGSNLPFQCKWNNNKVYTTRNNKDQINYIIKVYCESVKKKIEGQHQYILNYMKVNFNE